LVLWLANSYFSEESVSDVPASVEGAQNIRPALSQVNESQVTTPPQLTLEVETEENSAPTDQSTITPSLEELSVIASELLVEVDLDSNVDSSSAVISETSGSEGSPSLEDLASALQALRVEQAAGAKASSQPRVITIEAIGSDLLRISFIGESWIEVNDSESRQIYRDIREAGDVLEITGSAPFNILLGDAPFISMSLNGDEIDLSADIRIDNSARLTVGL
jgi:cytoskeleton protein RodZ